MGIEEIAKSGKPMSIGELRAYVEKKKSDESNIREKTLKKFSDAELEAPKNGFGALMRGVDLIESTKPEHAKLLRAILILCTRFNKQKAEAIEIVAHHIRKPIEFVEMREQEAISYVKDRLGACSLIIPA